MNGYPELSLHFDEDRLPPGQKPIVTAGVQQFQTISELLMLSRQQTGYSTMAVVIGWSGVGKTIAIQAFLQSLVPQPHTGLPACVVIKVKPGSSPRQLVADLLKSFGEKPRSLNLNRFKIADDAAEAILSNDLKILFVDDADQLNTECFELLRYIYAKTGCPIVLVGLRPIVRVISQHEKFIGRVGPRFDFPAPKEEEVLQTILPQLIFPYWSYDPKCEADYKVGKKVWASVQPSFRNLRTVMQYASTLTALNGKKRITLAMLTQSYQILLMQRHQEALSREDEGEDPPDEPQTEYEEESQRRHDSKKKKQEAE